MASTLGQAGVGFCICLLAHNAGTGVGMIEKTVANVPSLGKVEYDNHTTSFKLQGEAVLQAVTGGDSGGVLPMTLQELRAVKKESALPKQPGVPGLGLKYIGKDVLKAVVRKETLCTPKKYRRLMEWRGRVSGSEEEILDHLVNKGDVVRLAEDTILLPERCGPQLAAWGTGAGRNCKLKASNRGAYLEQMKDLQPDQFLCLGYGANFTAKNTARAPDGGRRSDSAAQRRQRELHELLLHCTQSGGGGGAGGVHARARDVRGPAETRRRYDCHSTRDSRSREASLDVVLRGSSAIAGNSLHGAWRGFHHANVDDKGKPRLCVEGRALLNGICGLVRQRRLGLVQVSAIAALAGLAATQVGLDFMVSFAGEGGSSQQLQAQAPPGTRVISLVAALADSLACGSGVQYMSASSAQVASMQEMEVTHAATYILCRLLNLPSNLRPSALVQAELARRHAAHSFVHSLIRLAQVTHKPAQQGGRSWTEACGQISVSTLTTLSVDEHWRAVLKHQEHLLIGAALSCRADISRQLADALRNMERPLARRDARLAGDGDGGGAGGADLA
ncbi:RING-type E3 ubiquitin transferase [Pseudoscourfieldia marina]